jgi:UDP-N-acetylmuramate-alanine ligase
MADFNSVDKLIAVCGKNGHTISILRWILSECGRCCRAVFLGEEEPGSSRLAVLLLSGPSDASQAEKFETCVADYDFSAMPQIAQLHPLTYSVGNDSADFTARNVREKDGVTTFEIVGVGVIGRVRLADCNEKCVKSALAAAAAAVACGNPFAEVLKALNSYKNIK